MSIHWPMANVLPGKPTDPNHTYVGTMLAGHEWYDNTVRW